MKSRINKNFEILAIIPARGGSKSIPKKNIKNLFNKPLLEYSINCAKNSKYVTRIIVSTDDKKIATIAKKAGAEVPFLRPKKLAKDDSKTIDVIKHAVEFLDLSESYKPDIITHLQPTTPFRTTSQLDKSINLLINSRATSILGVKKIKTHPYRAYWSSKKYLTPFKKNFLDYHQRQSFPDCYYPTGEIYVYWYNTLKKYGTIYGPKILPFIDKNSINIDIDTPFDFFVSEMKLRHWENFEKKMK